jgi:hypothetical protein
MPSGIGTATLNFGDSPGSNEASVAVTGQTTITTDCVASAYIMGGDTSTKYTAADHRYLAALIGLTCGTPTAATGFTIYGRSTQKIEGAVTVRWVWTD